MEERTVNIIAVKELENKRFEFLQYDNNFHFCKIQSKDYNMYLNEKNEIEFSSGKLNESFIKDSLLLEKIANCDFADELVNCLSAWTILQCKVTE